MLSMLRRGYRSTASNIKKVGKPMSALERTLMGFRCTDCDHLQKVPNAGEILRVADEDIQIMHNGLKVLAGGYYGDWMAHLIRGLKGHHEPQEEVIFAEIVRRSRHGSLIVELGCFWAYYSLWFVKDVPGARAVCFEPDPGNLAIGRRNAALNGLHDRTRFHNAMISGSFAESEKFVPESTKEDIRIPALSYPEIAEQSGSPIEVLHLDIQGAEAAFLRSMPSRPNIDVRFVVASTHHELISKSATTHEDCISELRLRGANILVDHSVDESFSGDGLIVASFLDEDLELKMPAISRNSKKRSLFR